MKRYWKEILALALIVLFYGSTLVYQIALPMADDMARHVTNGKMILEGHWSILFNNVYSYVQPGQPFVNHHWFSGVVFYLLLLVMGWGGLVLFKAVVLIATFLLLFRLATKRADFWLVAFLSLPAIFILIERTSLRPEIFSYLLIAVYLTLLSRFDEHPESNAVFWLVPLQALWVNLHIFFSIGVMIAAAYLAEKMLHTPPGGFRAKFSAAWLANLWSSQVVKKSALLVLLLVVASTFNPNGIAGALYRYPSDFPIAITENESPAEYSRTIAFGQDPSVVMFYALVPVLALSFIPVFKRGKRPYFYLFAAAATIAIGFTIMRGIVFFGMIFLPVAAANFNDWFIGTRRWLERESPRIARGVGDALFVALAGTLLFLILPSTYAKVSPDKKFGIGLTPMSQAAARFFRDNSIQGPVFNDTDIGSYLIYNLYPDERVFSDNRFGDAYSRGFFSDTYLPLLRNEDAWRAASDLYQFNAIFVDPYDGDNEFRAFLWRRLTDPAWVLVYGDQYAMIFVRNTPQNAYIIGKYAITTQNAGDRLRSLADSGDYDEMVAAADIDNLLGRGDLSAKLFLDVVTRWPEKAKIWMIMGEWELTRNDEQGNLLAMMYLDKAISLGKKTAEAYSFLGAAYARLGYRDQAEAALRRSLDINPDRQDAKDLLNKLQNFSTQ